MLRGGTGYAAVEKAHSIVSKLTRSSGPLGKAADKCNLLKLHQFCYNPWDGAMAVCDPDFMPGVYSRGGDASRVASRVANVWRTCGVRVA